MFSKENLDFQNLTFLAWTWPDLRSNANMSITIGIYVPNDLQNMCHATLVQWWPHVTWLWLWPILSDSIIILFTWHLRHPFRTFSQSLRLQLSLVWSRQADKAKRVRFDIWPDIDPTFNISIKKIALESPRWELSIADRSLFALVPLVRKLDVGGGRYSPPPPTNQR